MTTPTTSRVLATEQLPAVFRPSNQANLVPAESANMCVTQGMLPGLGVVRSGSPIGTGLAPKQERTFALQVSADAKQRNSAKADALQKLQQKIVTLSAQIQAADQQGNESKSARLRPQLAALNKKAELISQQLVVSQQASKQLAKPTWAQSTLVKAMGPTAMRMMSTPSTPDPLEYEPVGFSRQKNRAKILAMQTSTQPVTPINGVGELPEFFTKESIPGVPNWSLMAAAGALTLILILKKRG